jgi:hypothetical protein
VLALSARSALRLACRALLITAADETSTEQDAMYSPIVGVSISRSSRNP